VSTDQIVNQDVRAPASGSTPPEREPNWLGYCIGTSGQLLSWSDSPLAHRGQPGKFASIFSNAELNELVLMGNITAGRIRMVREGTGAPDRMWASATQHPDGSPGPLLPDGQRIRDLVRQGYTLTVNGLQKFSTGVFRLCSGLESELSCRINANAYLTPPSSQGLKSHFDDHDVIVLQIQGEKDWLVYGRYCETPHLPTNIELPADATPRLRTTLRAGDSLYVPRGFVHSAAATGQPSLHVSVGIFPPTVADLVKYTVAELADTPVLGRRLAPGFVARPRDLVDILADAAKYLQERLTDAEGATSTAEAFCRSWPHQRR
jgi:bifunctional lysine-specific demethylase and histidyl-hydroxylase NO66